MDALIEIIYGAVLGLLAGIAFQRISVFQVSKRSDDSAKVEAINNQVVIALWMLTSAALFALVFWKYSGTVDRIENIFIVSVAVNIAVVDFDIRKVPNSSLLILMLSKIGCMIADVIITGDAKNVIFPPILGLAVGLIIYSLPSMLKIPIGAGDVKYCGVIGFCLGIYGFLEASLVMGIVIAFYWIYLKITGKGSLKTVSAMGPFLSVGVIVTALLPITELINR